MTNRRIYQAMALAMLCSPFLDGSGKVFSVPRSFEPTTNETYINELKAKAQAKRDRKAAAKIALKTL